MITSLEVKILELKNEIKNLEERISDKKIELNEVEEELRHILISEKTNNIYIGDSLFFINEDNLIIETMLVTDSKGHLDLITLSSNEEIERGLKLNKRHLYLDSLVKDVEDERGWTLINEDD